MTNLLVSYEPAYEQLELLMVFALKLPFSHAFTFLLFILFFKEIPSLLNLVPNNPGMQEQMHLNPERQQFGPGGFPDNDTVASASVSSTKNKRGYTVKGSFQEGSNKRCKAVGSKDVTFGNSNASPSNVDIAPLTRLPAASEVQEASFFCNGVDTSTDHVRALAGANGAAVCLHAIETALKKSNRGISSRASTISAVSDITSGSQEGEALSTDEKAKQSRDRNKVSKGLVHVACMPFHDEFGGTNTRPIFLIFRTKQHARNTRVRKKAYVEELKRTLNEIVLQRDEAEYKRSQKEQSIAEQRDVRYRVLDEFLRLRGRNDADPSRWALILESDFALQLPRTDIPGVTCSSGHFDGADGSVGDLMHSYPLGTKKKQLVGVHQVMEDSKMVTRLLQSLGNGSANSSYVTSPLSVVYESDRSSFMMDGPNVVMSWSATSSGAVNKVCNKGDGRYFILKSEKFPFLSHRVNVCSFNLGGQRRVFNSGLAQGSLQPCIKQAQVG